MHVQHVCIRLYQRCSSTLHRGFFFDNDENQVMSFPGFPTETPLLVNTSCRTSHACSGVRAVLACNPRFLLTVQPVGDAITFACLSGHRPSSEACCCREASSYPKTKRPTAGIVNYDNNGAVDSIQRVLRRGPQQVQARELELLVRVS